VGGDDQTKENPAITPGTGPGAKEEITLGSSRGDANYSSYWPLKRLRKAEKPVRMSQLRFSQSHILCKCFLRLLTKSNF
jgi:hypothetical protein